MNDQLPAQVRAGDIFCSANPMRLGKVINAIQRFWDIDNKSKYGHAGIITSSTGQTFEALWTVKHGNVFRDYYEKAKSGEGSLLIGRNIHMNHSDFVQGWNKVRHFRGRRYPIHRLFLHLIPVMGKYITTGRFLVCSELTAKFLKGAGKLDFYKGVNPNYLADMILKWDDWEPIYQSD